MSEYTHRASSPVILDRTLTYPKHRYFKPSGLWFEVDRDWERWCISEGFRTDSLRAVHRLELDQARILTIADETALDRFTAEYLHPDGKDSYYRIDWDNVAANHAGIVIAPYLWSRRLTHHSSWYYSWDCASGCVWDLSAITQFELIEIVAEMTVHQ